jgi:hypothetical protein
VVCGGALVWWSYFTSTRCLVTAHHGHTPSHAVLTFQPLSSDTAAAAADITLLYIFSRQSEEEEEAAWDNALEGGSQHRRGQKDVAKVVLLRYYHILPLCTF